MSIKPISSLLGLLLVAILLAPGPAPAAPATGPAPATVADELRGMVVRDPWYDCNPAGPGLPREPNRAAQQRMGQILAHAGVRWVRLEFFVSDRPGGLNETFNCYDYFLNEVAPANNLQVLGLLGFGLVRDRDPLDPNTGIITTTTFTHPDYGSGVNDYMRDWLDRALKITDRYKGRLAALEVLNEQNRLPPSGEAVPAYLASRLHTKFYRVFKIERRKQGEQEAWRDSLPILIGGLHPRGSGTFDPEKPEEYISDIGYLRQYFGYPRGGGTPDPKAPFQEFKATAGQGQYPADGLAYHPYPAEIVSLAGVEQIAAEMTKIQGRMQAMRATLSEVSAADLPFWITEIGYDAGRPQQNATGQAEFLRAVFALMAGRGDVHTVFWFKYEDFPGSDIAPNRWGIVHIPFTLSPSCEDGICCEGGACYEPSGEPSDWRPAYLAYRELAGATIRQHYLPAILYTE